MCVLNNVTRVPRARDGGAVGAHLDHCRDSSRLECVGVHHDDHQIAVPRKRLARL